jgi:tRNA pseudouridine38-40 synthase
VRTVEGSLIQALRRLTWWGDGCLEMSSRTDAGVSVRMGLARIDLPESVSRSASDARIAKALNDNLPVGMVVLAAKRAPSDSKVRYAEYRSYLYRLGAVEEWPSNPDPELVRNACSLIEGRHDFTNLSRSEEDRDPLRTVDECVPWCAGDGRPVGFSIRARSFLWNQVRRIASAISGVASGRVSLIDLESALSRPGNSVDLGRAPADGLVLWEISHSDFDAPASDGLPDASALSTRPDDPREYRRWLSMAGYEMSALLEREWLGRLS